MFTRCEWVGLIVLILPRISTRSVNLKKSAKIQSRMKPRFLVTTLLVIGLTIVWFFCKPPVAAVATSSYIAKAVGVNLQRLPIGDGRVSTSPTLGSVWSCRTQLGRDGVGGAENGGSWLHNDGTYDLTAKPIVDGAIVWPSKFSIQLKNNIRSIIGNRLPKDPTGEFPISPDNNTYMFDRNPNTITAATYQVNLPALPQVAAAPSCLPLGAIGVLLNGGYFFNALDAGGQDAVAHEIQDRCQGHPEVTGAYHYHSVTPCLEQKDRRKGHAALVGYAFDGFGIYGHRGPNGKDFTNADLDECHGHTHNIEWNRKQENLYHYHATWEYPYTVGCFKGTMAKIPRQRRLRRDRPHPPPPHPIRHLPGVVADLGESQRN
jgi:YHYH protein